MAVGELVRLEAGRVDWGALACGCGDSAEHVPLMIEAIISAETPRDMLGYTLDGHVEDGSLLFPCTPAAVGVIMAALAGDLSRLARDELLQTLVSVAAGSAGHGPDGEGPGLGEECRRHAQGGFWRLVQLGLTGSAENAEAVADLCAYWGLAATRPMSTGPRCASVSERRPNGGGVPDAARHGAAEGPRGAVRGLEGGERPRTR